MTLLLVLMHIVPVPSSLFYWVMLTFYLEDILCNICLLLNTNLEHHIQQLEIIPLSLALLLLHLLKYYDSIYCGFLVCANTILYPCCFLWLKDVPEPWLSEDLNSTLKQFIQPDAKINIHIYYYIQLMVLKVVIFSLHCDCNILSLHSVCSCNHLHAMTWFARQKKDIYMKLKGVIPVS